MDYSEMAVMLLKKCTAECDLEESTCGLKVAAIYITED